MGEKGLPWALREGFFCIENVTFRERENKYVKVFRVIGENPSQA